MYGIELYNQYFEYVTSISTYTKFECARALNKAGKFVLTLPLTDFSNLFTWKPDMMFRFYRNVGSTRYLVGNTIWFLEDIELDFENKEVKLSGHDTIGLLSRYVVAYTRGTDYAEKTIEFGLSDYASNLMKQFLRENVGSLVFDVDRDLSTYITITADDDIGAVAEKDASFQTLESVCGALCDQSAEAGTPIFYDLIPSDDNHLTFIVYNGQLGKDHTVTDQIVFSPFLNNLREAVLLRLTSGTTNTAYMGGDGVDASRLIVEVQNAEAVGRSPFGRRETFFEEKEMDNTSTLTKRGREVLEKNSERYVLAGKIFDLPNQRFGTHYGFGDKVLVNIGGYIGEALISAFSVNSSAENSDELDIRLRGEVIVP